MRKRSGISFLLIGVCFLFNVAFAQESEKASGTGLSEEVKAAPLLPLERHKLVYIISGKPNTKVQFSFKYKIVKKIKFYFGYSQVMYWDLFEDSSPFKDITYNPELFYEWEVQWGLLKSIIIGPIEHQSNGKGGVESRSLDSSYLQFNAQKSHKNWEFNLNTKVSYFYGLSEYNEDIKQYMGLWQVQGSVVKTFARFVNNVELYVRLFPGGKTSFDFSKGGQEIGLKFRLNFPSFGIHFFVQAYRGYIGSLLNYSEKENSYRIGILL